MADGDILIFEASIDGPDKWTERALVWIEYLVLMEGYDRSLPGFWAEQPGDEPRVWIVARERLRDSVLNAQRHHRRAIVSLRVLLGHGPRINEEAAVMNAILIRLPTHEERTAALDGRSPATELLGVDLLGATTPQQLG
jgi:hypothetical protein